ncbi:amino acid permease [Novosphingobium sp.]|uniref:APC family permease n=1 Tax=Novosphingobium sp. TaxID=1874826 RepID=UPI0025D445D9|nr:amino acid permease [Novosphingobium sp.]MCC6926297.1 amino acid permease [Novosphingobium sp.]
MAQQQDQTLERPFGLWTATALVVGGTIGAGIFVLPSQLAAYGQTSVAGWLIAIAGTMLLGLTIGALVRARPQASGLMELCSDGLGAGVSVLMGWAYWVSVWASVAVLATTGASYLAVFVPWLGQSPLNVALGAVAIIWVITAMNLTGARTAGRFQVLTTLLKLLPLIAVVLILLRLVLGGGEAFSQVRQAPFSTSQLPGVLNLVFYALVGFETAAMAAERVRQPERNVPLATIAGTALIGALYLVISTGIAFAMPTEQLTNSGAPVADFVSRYWGPWAGQAVAAFAAISAIGCLNAWVLISGEVPLGMARTGLIPDPIGKLSAHGIAARPVIAASICASVLVLSNLSRGTAGLFDFMMRLTSSTNLILYLGVCVVALRFKVVRPVALLALAFSLWTLVGAGWEVLAWGGLLLLTALPLHMLNIRIRSAGSS